MSKYRINFYLYDNSRTIQKSAESKEIVWPALYFENSLHKEDRIILKDNFDLEIGSVMHYPNQNFSDVMVSIPCIGSEGITEKSKLIKSILKTLEKK